MITKGFVPSSGDLVTIGTRFTATISGVVTELTASYVGVSFTGTAGDIVWENYNGDLNFTPAVQAGMVVIIGARRIVASGIVNGTSRTTTAVGMFWLGSNDIS